MDGEVLSAALEIAEAVHNGIDEPEQPSPLGRNIPRWDGPGDRGVLQQCTMQEQVGQEVAMRPQERPCALHVRDCLRGRLNSRHDDTLGRKDGRQRT